MEIRTTPITEDQLAEIVIDLRLAEIEIPPPEGSGPSIAAWVEEIRGRGYQVRLMVQGVERRFASGAGCLGHVGDRWLLLRDSGEVISIARVEGFLEHWQRQAQAVPPMHIGAWLKMELSRIRIRRMT